VSLVEPEAPVIEKSRKIFDRIKAYLREDWALRTRYLHVRRFVRQLRLPAFYEMTQRCNLRCEGCYYFEGGSDQAVVETQDLALWERFFRAEGERGVSMAYFVGAESALVQDRLAAASQYLKIGQAGTNGTIFIDKAIPYRIVLSVWAGDDATDRDLRGGAVFRKAIRNYAGDRRAILLYTITRRNLAGIQLATALAADNGLKITFNMYSPSSGYLSKLVAAAPNDQAFFRTSSPEDNLIFAPADLLQVRNAVEAVMAEWPETVVYSRAYNRWITSEGPLYAVDEAGIARHCRSRLQGNFKYFTTDLQPAQLKCCTPSLDCRQCRIYSGGWSTRLEPGERDVATMTTFLEWLEMIETLERIVMYRKS
jgi:hypothetical protein